MMEKKCKDCGEIKELELFSRDKNMKDGHTNSCKVCKATYLRGYRAKFGKTEHYRKVELDYARRTQKNQRWLE